MYLKRTPILLGALVVSLLTANEASAQCVAPTCTKIINNGSDVGRKVLVVMGDGYTAAEQGDYNAQVDTMVTNGLFGHDFFQEQHNAFNVYRLNLNSVESGVSQIDYDENGTSSDPSDDTIISQTTKNTALKYIYSGSWAHCWLQHSYLFGINLTDAAKTAALNNSNLAAADYVVVLLNDPGFGGCNRGPRDIVQTRSSSWQVVAHEAGHGIGGLRDEYSASGKGAYSGAAVNTLNCSTTLNRNTVLWNRFIDPATPVPTTLLAGMDSNRTVGEFSGCGTWESGIYRPVHNCRMKGNTPNYCPVCQTLMRKSLYPSLAHDFSDTYPGDFDGDGRSDLLVQNGNDLAIYRSSGSPGQLDRVWTANNLVPSALGSNYYWTLAAGDKFFVADFNGDGRDDVYVLNTTSWGTRYLGLLRSNGTGLETVIHYGGTLPGYGSIGSADQLFVADFDADGKQDLYLFTGTSWSTEYMGLLRSTGTALTTTVRYDGTIPGSVTWVMSPQDKFYVGDFDGDNRDDLFVFNGLDWSSKYLGMVRATGTGLSELVEYAGTLASGWNMGAHDQHFVGDIDGDNKDDLYVYNGADWGVAYLELTKSTGAALNFVKRYDDDAATAWATNIPGWVMKTGDKFFVSDANKDGKADLFVFNTVNWGTEYLGTLLSSSTALSGSSSGDWVNGAGADWNIGASDQIQAVNYEGGAGKADIFIRNSGWFGMIRRTVSGLTLDRIYYHSIYTPLYDSKPWSDSMP